MMHDQGQRRARLRALHLYTLLVRLYPKAHRQAFGSQMQQTFVDHYRDTRTSQGRVGIAFWLGVLCDAVWSIGREHLAVVQSAVGSRGLRPYVPAGFIMSGAVVAAAAGERSALLVCTLLAALVFAATSSADIVPKAAVCAAALGLALGGTLLASLTGQWRDLFDPILLLVTLFFGAKTAAGIQVRLAGQEEALWRREELLWGTMVAFLLLVACGIALLPPDDAWVSLATVLGLMSPTVCGGVGGLVSRASSSIRAGFFASVAALALGLMMWVISLPPAVVLGTWITHGNIGLHSTDPSAFHLWQTSAVWEQKLRVIPNAFPTLLFMGVVGGFLGAICGSSPIENEMHGIVPSTAGDARP